MECTRPLKPCRRSGWCLSVGFLFRGENLTFFVLGVIYKAFLKNYPIPQEVKGMADGDSLRQLFSFSGLTFACARGIVQHSFRTQATCLCQSAGGFAHVSTGFFELTSSLGIVSSLIMRRMSDKFPNSQARPRRHI